MKDFKEFNVELDEEHSVGDSVWAKDQTNKAKTNTGTITKVGRTMVHVKHKDGTTTQYPHKDVASEYSTLRPAMKEEVLDELSTDTLASYKKKATEDGIAADKAGDNVKGHKRFKGVLKATFKQFANDAK